MPDAKPPVCSHCHGALAAPIRACAACEGFYHQACAEALRERCPSLACRRPLVGQQAELARSIRFSLEDLALMVGLPLLVGLFFHRALPPAWKGLKVACWAYPLPLSSCWAALRRLPLRLRRAALAGGPLASWRLLLLVSPLLALALFAKGGGVDGEAVFVTCALALWFACVAVALNLFRVAATAELVRGEPVVRCLEDASR